VPETTAIHGAHGYLVAGIQKDLTAEILSALERDLLARIFDSEARAVVVDVAGLSVIGPDEFAGLSRILAMAKLMGATPLLSGLSAGIASAMVDLGVDTRGITVVSSLDDAYLWLRARGLVKDVGR
jgi:anti-anti-sigma regulatory factor